MDVVLLGDCPATAFDSSGQYFFAKSLSTRRFAGTWEGKQLASVQFGEFKFCWTSRKHLARQVTAGPWQCHQEAIPISAALSIFALQVGGWIEVPLVLLFAGIRSFNELRISGLAVLLLGFGTAETAGTT